MKKTVTFLCTLVMTGASLFVTSCGTNNQKVTIYTSTEDYNMEYMQTCLEKEFPNYQITIEYMSTSNIAAKIIEEGASSDCDIIYAEEYGYMEKWYQLAF